MPKPTFRILPLFALLAALGLPTAAQGGPNDSVWTRLFNPQDPNIYNNWDIKVRKSTLNVDTRNTFRYGIAAGDTFLDVNYSGWTTFLDGSDELHSHAGYKHRPFSHYLLRGEYMVMSAAAPTGAPTWAYQNNGFMLHSQSVASMGLNQDFPISIEAQLLGANSNGNNPAANSTMNLCTPGTAFYTTPTGGSVNTTHCIPSRQGLPRAATLSWQKVSALVLGDSLHRFFTGSGGTDSALTYYRPVYWAGSIVNPPTGVPANGTRLTGGYITIQGESAPYRFRRIDVLNLEGCMTPGDLNHKSYLIKHDSTACAGATGIRGTSPQEARQAAPLTFVGNSIRLGGVDKVKLELYDMSGARVGGVTAQAPFQWSPAVKASGVHVIRAITPKGTYTEKATLF